MTSEEMTTGGMSTSSQARAGYARDSRSSNNANSTFVREFPELVEENAKYVNETKTKVTKVEKEVKERGYVNWYLAIAVVVVIIVISRMMGD